MRVMLRGRVTLERPTYVLSGSVSQPTCMGTWLSPFRDPDRIGHSAHLHFDNICFQGLHERNHLATLSRGNFKSIQGRIDMAKKCLPIGLTDLHPFMRNLHVTPGVIHGPAGTRTEKINQELFFSLDAVLSSMFPETLQPRIRHYAWQQVIRDCTHSFIASETFIESFRA